MTIRPPPSFVPDTVSPMRIPVTPCTHDRHICGMESGRFRGCAAAIVTRFPDHARDKVS